MCRGATPICTAPPASPAHPQGTSSSTGRGVQPVPQGHSGEDGTHHGGRPHPPMSPTCWSRIPLGSISRGKHTRWNPGASQGSLGMTWAASAMLHASVSSPAMRLCKHERGWGCMSSVLLPAPAQALGRGSPSTWTKGGHHEHPMSPRPFHGCSHTAQWGESSGRPVLLLGGGDRSSVEMRRNGIGLAPISQAKGHAPAASGVEPSTEGGSKTRSCDVAIHVHSRRHAVQTH